MSATKQPSLSSVADIQALLQADLTATNQLILQELESDVALINQLGFYIVNSGGKRLRPLLVLLCANALNYSGEAHHKLAAVIEFIHTATLLHDDVVDASDLRRGKETANALFGNEASVLTGDFLYSRAFQMMVNVASMPVMDLLADTTNLIAEGEVLQLMNCNDPDISEQDYYEVIRRKTAILFAAACELGAIVSQQDQMREALRDYGMNLGMAFQVVDDMLDYVSSAEEMGKNVGDDLAEGKPTLPLMHALKHGTEEQKETIRHAIKEGDASQLQMILTTIQETNAIEYCTAQAKVFTDRALAAISGLEESSHKSALQLLANLALARKS
ncbi:polyprenyl synthetase family protein [Pleionea sp. CnH1-48]|uniref:polyprenyl synthetase family protein n=1 Tax=Pleionea sp. CnH1-48 TaxID=2954494 RepID=UPI00209863D7|nr:polyprenyl synthetase family protein [Pleionea sp. CnH1-48]MCO7222885.1 polyprenyl synthetase family protein [Pleionea sp. CnH1-48]